MIQIFGTKKCKDTNKAIRFFKERRVQFQFVDLNEKEVSKGELNNIKRSVPIEDLIDKDGKMFKKMNLEYMAYDTEEILLENPLLFKTPIVRLKQKAFVGHDPDGWKELIM